MDLDQYKKLIYSTYNEEEEITWVPSVSAAKEKMLAKLASSTNKSCDITGCKKSEIEKEIEGCNLIYCDQFTVKLYGDEKYTVKLYERMSKIPNGIPCSVDVMVDVSEDNRFRTSPWASNFKGKTGYCMTLEDLVDMCKWLLSAKMLISFV